MSSQRSISASLLLFVLHSYARQGVISPLAQRCASLQNVTTVACINHYASAMPAGFFRPTSWDGEYNSNDTFQGTSVPSDPSWQLVKNASFIVFDEVRGSQILGSDPTLDFMFSTRNDSIHEAPVYVPPPLNAIIFSIPHVDEYQQRIINLNSTPPTLSNFTTMPPIYAVNGGKYYGGQVYWASEAGTCFPTPSVSNSSNSTTCQTPGIYRMNPYTRTSEVLLNNYFGKQFNSPNDLFIDSRGDVFFTDSWYGWAINVTSYPVLKPQTWRFRPSTGQVSVAEDTIAQPNGIGISPDGRTMYITDTGVTDFSANITNMLPKYTYNSLGGNNVYAFDVNFAPPGNYLTNKRPVRSAEEFGDDGFHVSRDGYLLGAAGLGVDILSAWGEMIMRIETPTVINNIQFAGPERKDLWLFGEGGIYRVKWSLQGMVEE